MRSLVHVVAYFALMCSAFAASSATVPVGGGTVTLSIAPTTSWATTFTTSTDPTKFPVITIGAGGNANIVHQDAITVAAAKNGSNVDLTLSLTGYVMSGETATVTIPAGYITDNLGAGHGLISALSITNNSTHTIGTAHTRFKGLPVVTWATRHKFPNAGTTQRIAFDATDCWAGVDYVEVTFDGSITPVSDAQVTNVAGNIYKIASYRKIDLFGDGKDAPYWYMDVDISGASEGDGRTVTITKVRTLDGVDHNPTSGIGGAVAVNGRTITKLSTPTVRYLDTTATGGTGAGTSWANAYTTATLAETGVGSTADIVYIAPGTYTASGFDWDQSRNTSTGKYVRWVVDANRTGDGSGVVTFNVNASTAVRSLQSFEGIKFAIGSSGHWRITGPSYFVNLENCQFVGAGGVPQISFNAGGYYSEVGCSHDAVVHPGLVAIGTSPVNDVIFQNNSFVNGGTTQYAAFFNVLCQFQNTQECADAGATPGTHFDWMHSYRASVTATNGGAWTESTKTLSKTNGFANLALDTDMTVVGVFSGTNVITGFYKVVSKTSNDAIVLEQSITGGAGDTTGITFIAGSSCFNNHTVRYNYSVDNGSAAKGVNYNFALLEYAGRNLACYGNVSFSHQSLQQVLQIQSNPKNLQIVHNTLLASDTIAQGDSRGLAFSGKLAPNPYDQSGFAFRNNITHIMTGTLGGVFGVDPNAHLSGICPTNYYRKRLYGPNLVTNQSADGGGANGAAIVLDGTVKTSTSGLTVLGLGNITSSPYDFRPATSSPAYHTNFTTSPSDYKFDMNGAAYSGEAGAMQIAVEDPENPEDPPPPPPVLKKFNRAMKFF